MTGPPGTPKNLLFFQIADANWFTDLFGGKKAEEAHAKVYNEDPQVSQPASGNAGKRKASWTHELIAAAAGYEAMRAYERHKAKQSGQAVNHSIVKGVLAGLAAAAVDRLIETKGLDYIDAQRAKSKATQAAETIAAEKGYQTQAQSEGTPRQNLAGTNGADYRNAVREADPELIQSSGQSRGSPTADEYRR